MHVVVGIAVTLFAFITSQWVAQSITFGGLVNPAAMVLLALGPIGVSLISHPFSEWRSNLSVLGRSFRHDKYANLLVAAEEMLAIGRAVRETRWDEAEAAITQSRSEQVRNLSPHLLARLEPDALHEAIANSSFRWMAEVKTADDFLQGLARLSPAFGMIGTIMGLVDLFANMRDSSSLGPGMAMALLATLYGLILCYCFYLPLAQRIRTYLTLGSQEQRVIEQAIHLVIAGRPVNEVRTAVLDAAKNGGAPSLSMAPVEPGAR